MTNDQPKLGGLARGLRDAPPEGAGRGEGPGRLTHADHSQRRIDAHTDVLVFGFASLAASRLTCEIHADKAGRHS